MFEQSDLLERLLKEKDARIEDLLRRLADKDVPVLQRSAGRKELQNMKEQVDGTSVIDVDEIDAPDRVSTSSCTAVQVGASSSLNVQALLVHVLVNKFLAMRQSERLHPHYGYTRTCIHTLVGSQAKHHAAEESAGGSA